MSRSLIVDPKSERAANSPLEILTEPGRGPGVYVTGHQYPDPEEEILTAGGREGKKRTGPPMVGNRQVPLELYVMGRREDYPGTLKNVVLNPSAALDLTAISGSSLVAGPTRVVDLTAPIGAETAVEAKTDAAADRVNFALAGGVLPKAPFWRASAWVKITSLTGEAGFRIALRGFGGLKANGLTVKTLGEWVRLDLLWNGNEALEIIPQLCIEQIGAGTGTVLVTGTMLTATETLLDYFDGDTPGSSWEGTAHNSASTQPGAGLAHFEKIVADLEDKLQKLRDEGGTYSRRYEAGRMVLDVEGLIASEGGEYDGKRWIQRGQKFATVLECRPYGRGLKETKTLRSQTTDPVLVFTETLVPGSARALGELEIADTATKERRALIAGIEVPVDYDATAATAGLYLQAETLTPLGPSALAADAGATGAGNNVVSGTLDSGWRELLSTKIAATSKHLTHVGLFRVFARIKLTGFTEQASYEFGLQYGQGDLVERIRNDVVAFFQQASARYVIADLGIVRLEKAKVGLQRWEGRIIGRSTDGKPNYAIDDLRIVPVSAAYLGAKVPAPSPGTPVSFTGLDYFNQVGGALNGKSAEVGGVWATSGGEGDFTVDGAIKKIKRTAKTAARLALLPTVYSGAQATRLTFGPTPPEVSYEHGFYVRYTDANNYFRVLLLRNANRRTLLIDKRVAGVTTTIKSHLYGLHLYETEFDLGIMISSSGYFAIYAETTVGAEMVTPVYEGFDPALATGGSLASGKFAITDSCASETARTYDNVQIWTPSDPVLISSGRRLRWRHDGVQREDSAGGEQWSNVGYEGDPLLLPVSTKEARALRAIVFPSRGDLQGLPDEGNSDDFTAQLALTARHLNVRA